MTTIWKEEEDCFDVWKDVQERRIEKDPLMKGGRRVRPSFFTPLTSSNKGLPNRKKTKPLGFPSKRRTV